MSQYTEGPWRITGGNIRGRWETAGHAPIAKMVGDKRTTDHSIQKANGYLIAAAPELLECAQELLAALERDLPPAKNQAAAAERFNMQIIIGKALGKGME